MTLVLAILQEDLHTVISTDLEYLKAWSCRWLVKFNPNKTDIMIVLITVCKSSCSMVNAGVIN
jgi:hypothetical protein